MYLLIYYLNKVCKRHYDIMDNIDILHFYNDCIFCTSRVKTVF